MLIALKYLILDLQFVTGYAHMHSSHFYQMLAYLFDWKIVYEIFLL